MVVRYLAHQHASPTTHTVPLEAWDPPEPQGKDDSGERIHKEGPSPCLLALTPQCPGAVKTLVRPFSATSIFKREIILSSRAQVHSVQALGKTQV